MSRLKIYAIAGFLVVVTIAFKFHTGKITVYLIGDSTMSVKPVSSYPEHGWGMPFALMFDSTVVVDNRAMNGRSTRTFISENRWRPIAEALKPGDYVFIQFGHNDEVKEKTDRYTPPEDYKKNLKKFISETRARKANPILLTPVTRRKFKDGKIQETHPEYSPLVHELGNEFGVPVIDLDKLSRALLQDLGEESSKLLFLQLEPGEHPNYPEGKNDNTHFNELGARKMAQIVLQELKRLDIDLAKRIVTPPVKK